MFALKLNDIYYCIKNIGPTLLVKVIQVVSTPDFGINFISEFEGISQSLEQILLII